MHTIKHRTKKQLQIYGNKTPPTIAKKMFYNIRLVCWSKEQGVRNKDKGLPRPLTHPRRAREPEGQNTGVGQYYPTPVLYVVLDT